MTRRAAELPNHVGLRQFQDVDMQELSPGRSDPLCWVACAEPWQSGMGVEIHNRGPGSVLCYGDRKGHRYGKALSHTGIAEVGRWSSLLVEYVLKRDSRWETTDPVGWWYPSVYLAMLPLCYEFL